MVPGHCIDHCISILPLQYRMLNYLRSVLLLETLEPTTALPTCWIAAPHAMLCLSQSRKQAHSRCCGDATPPSDAYDACIKHAAAYSVQ